MKVLILDDDPTVRDDIWELLSFEDIECKTFGSVGRFWTEVYMKEKVDDYDVFIFDLTLLPSKYHRIPSKYFSGDISGSMLFLEQFCGLHLHIEMEEKLRRSIPVYFLTGTIIPGSKNEKILKAYVDRDKEHRKYFHKASSTLPIIEALKKGF